MTAHNLKLCMFVGTKLSLSLSLYHSLIHTLSLTHTLAFGQALDTAKGTVTTAKLNLIDLAGSERVSKTNAKKHMLTEVCDLGAGTSICYA